MLSAGPPRLGNTAQSTCEGIDNWRQARNCKKNTLSDPNMIGVPMMGDQGSTSRYIRVWREEVFYVDRKSEQT